MAQYYWCYVAHRYTIYSSYSEIYFDCLISKTLSSVSSNLPHLMFLYHFFPVALVEQFYFSWTSERLSSLEVKWWKECVWEWELKVEVSYYDWLDSNSFTLTQRAQMSQTSGTSLNPAFKLTVWPACYLKVQTIYCKGRLVSITCMCWHKQTHV